MIVDGVFVLIIVVLASALIHYRAKANATSAASATALSGVASSLTSELEMLRGDVRAMVDSKFNALGKWLLSEMQKMVDATAPSAPEPSAPAPDPVAPAAPDADASSPVDAAAATTEPPSAGGDGTDVITQIDASIVALTAKRDAIAAARKSVSDAQEKLKALL
jgi:hypothetical protein